MIPLDIVRTILSFDNHFVIRGPDIIQINRLDKNDTRYEMLTHILPTMNDTETCVFIKIANTERYYYMEYSEDDSQNHFRFSLMDYDATYSHIEANDETNDPHEYQIYYNFSTDKLVL